MSNLSLAQKAKKEENVSINGKIIHYEVYGEGKPLIFLHGYSQSTRSWRPYVSDFINEYEVYLIDLPGHGQSEPFKEDLSIEKMGEDINALMAYLELDEIQSIGFSCGGDVLYQVALQNPDLIDAMITIGAVGTWDVNEFKQYQEVFTFENSENFPWLKEAHSSDDQIRKIMDEFIHYTVVLTDEDLQRIKPEVLIMIGDDDDGMNLTEVARVKKNLPNSDLWILPNVSHGAHEGETREEFVEKAKAFLDKDR